MTIATFCFTMALSGCASQKDSDVVKESVESTGVETQQLTEQDSLESESQNMVAETETESVSEAPVEMVDWETWAKQEGNDKVCMVVWNENLGIQEIMPTLQETEEKYQMQEGNRYAIPYNEKVIQISVNKEVIQWLNEDYYEVFMNEGEINMVYIIYEKENGEHETINYVLE